MNWSQYFGIAAAVWIAPHTSPIVGLCLGGVCIVFQIVSIYTDNKK